MKFGISKTEKSKPLGKNYWRLWIAHATSNLGDGISSIAYPWLASAVTRSPILISLVAVVSRLPWLVFTLPAGVITDRFDRRRIIVAMDICRGFLALFVAVAVTIDVSSLPDLQCSFASAEEGWRKKTNFRQGKTVRMGRLRPIQPRSNAVIQLSRATRGLQSCGCARKYGSAVLTRGSA